MALSTSPSHSPWAPQTHGIDYNGYVGSPSSPGAGDNSFDSKASRQRRGSSPGKRALNWFTRSRSASPQPVVPDGPPSPSSFVVRSVVKLPGGVSHFEDVHGSPIEQDPYRKVKSQPLHSLGVPPGGPGGGVGYGTAKSPNDGRPVVEQEPAERGRSRSKSPTRPPSPGAITAGAFRGGRISPGQLSFRQMSEQEERAKQEQMQNKMSSSTSSREHPSSVPGGPRTSPFNVSTSPLPRQSSPLSRAAAEPTVSRISAQANEHPSRFSMPVHIPHGSGPPPVIPLDNLPSPVRIPISPNQAGTSPFGSASPASPAYFGTSQEDGDRSHPSSPNVASRWFKGLFGKSPRLEEHDDGVYSNEGQWMRHGTSPLGAQKLTQQSAHIWTDGSPLAGARPRDEVEAEAVARKKHSMMMAARIEDEHRDRLMSTGTGVHTPDRRGHIANNKPWSPAQVIGDAPMTQEPDWDPPQNRSPPGRKPPPRFTAQDLEAMSEREREQIATEVDPEDRLSRLEGRLTPAQQIIAETRSKMMEREKITTEAMADVKGKGKQPASANVQRGFETSRTPSNDTRPPTLPSKSLKGPQQKETANVSSNMPNRQQPVKVQQKQDGPSAGQQSGSSSANGLSAGNGPMPKDMPLPQALQEMMVRFYRFERYAVPLMRSLEGRLIDVERDNQMALNGDGMSANSARDREMDRWVGQMTGLMRHEVGQLQAATREIREARELLANVAKGLGATNTASGFLPGRSVQQKEPVASVESNLVVPTQKANSPPNADKESTQSQVKDESDTVADLPVKRAVQDDESRRTSNFSSASFNSAVRKPAATSVGNEVSMVTSTNASPNGRPRYTHALGRPLQDGKISPLVSPTKEREPPLELAPSPAPSEQSGTSRRAMSVDERLKALINEKARSPSMTTQGGESSIKSGMSLHAHQESGNSSDDTSFERIAPSGPSSAKIGGDYQLVTARGSSEASARSASEEYDPKEAGVDQGEGIAEKEPTRSLHLQTPSSFSTQTNTTVKPTVQRQTSASRTLSMPTSPQPPLSPNMTGSSFKLASVISTPTRRRSASPINMVPSSPSAITTSSNASHGLRARAQSYLQKADASGSIVANSTSNSASMSASNSWNASANVSPTLATKAAASADPGSSSVLRSRTMNASSSSAEISTQSSLDEVSVRPLMIKKSVHSIKSRDEPSGSNEGTPAANMDTIKGSTVKSAQSANSAATTPSRPSIRDRVAFFDAQRG